MRKITAFIMAIIMVACMIPTAFAEQDSACISVSELRAKPGETVSVEVNIENNPGLVGLRLTFNYDEDLTLINAENGNVFNGSDDTYTFSQYFTDNPYFAMWLSTASSNITTDGTLLTLTFQVKESAEFGKNASIKVTCIEACDVNLNPVELTMADGGILITKTYTVNFIDWDGTILSTQEIEHGNSAFAPQNPERTGYTFTGWDKEFDHVTADMDVTAQYEINTYTVTFKDGLTGDVISSDTVEYGSDAVFPEAPFHDGYTFMCWDNDGKNITANTVITAQYVSDEEGVLIGDVTGDGEVNTGDAVAILKFSVSLISLNDMQQKAADTTKDGSVNTADAVLVLKYSAGLITEF